jgi:hypothetical protein
MNAGISMGLLYVITGRLWASIGMHLGYDFIETSVLGIDNHHGFLISTPKAGGAAWLTGGTFGPDAAVPAMVLGLLVNVVIWRFAWANEWHNPRVEIATYCLKKNAVQKLSHSAWSKFPRCLSLVAVTK